MEEAGASVPVAGAPAEYSFEAGNIVNAWTKLNEVRRQFQGNAQQSAELGDLLTTQDFNGVRGPDQGEMECFEKLISSGEQPLLRAIFEHNAKEAMRSGDLGNARNVMPGVESLLAFYLTVGDEGSMRFVEGFLTTGPAAQMLQTKYKGRYFTEAGPVVSPALESCVNSAGSAATP
jgi:hypothetical protein